MCRIRIELLVQNQVLPRESAKIYNLLTLTCEYLESHEHQRLICVSQSLYDCNVTFEEARLNLALLEKQYSAKWHRYIVNLPAFFIHYM